MPSVQKPEDRNRETGRREGRELPRARRDEEKKIGTEHEDREMGRNSENRGEEKGEKREKRGRKDGNLKMKFKREREEQRCEGHFSKCSGQGEARRGRQGAKMRVEKCHARFQEEAMMRCEHVTKQH